MNLSPVGSAVARLSARISSGERISALPPPRIVAVLIASLTAFLYAPVVIVTPETVARPSIVSIVAPLTVSP